VAVGGGPQVGDFVVVPSRRALGVGRLVAVLEEDGASWGRVHFYDDGLLELIPWDQLEPAPAGKWEK
jgi:hypothetical protein